VAVKRLSSRSFKVLMAVGLLAVLGLLAGCGTGTSNPENGGDNTGGGGGNTVPSFEMTLSPDTLVVTQGEAGTLTLKITPINNFNGTVTLTLVNPPPGVEISPSKVNVPGREVSQSLVVTTTLETPVGNHTVTVKGTSGDIEKSVSFRLTVNESLHFTVNTEKDTIDVKPGDGVCADADGNCSLRAAVMEANALKAPVVINVPEGVYELINTSSSEEQDGDLDISADVIIKGAGPGATIIDGSGKNRIFEIADFKVSIEGLTIRNGGNVQNGGGIYNAGTLRLSHVEIVGNTASGCCNGGGGVYNAKVLSIKDSYIHGNTAKSGGGIYSSRGSVLLIEDSRINDNKAHGWGGGLLLGGADVVIQRSTIENNQAAHGGGILNDASSLSIKGSTIVNNRADGNGGGILIKGCCNWGTASILNSTISVNSAVDNGGGLRLEAGEVQLQFTTIANNKVISTQGLGGGISVSRGNLSLKGTILANNSTEGGAGPDCAGAMTSLGYNLIESNADCDIKIDLTDITNQDPLLGDLANNGGLTKTHMPLPESPAIDQIPPDQCSDIEGNPVETDQRGIERPQGPKCDIGAVERN